MSPVNQSIAEKGTKCNAAGKEARQAVYRYTGIALPGVRRGAIRRGNTGGRCLHALVYWAGVQPAFSLVFRSPGRSSFASLRVGKCMRASSVTIGILSRRSASFSACVLHSRAFASRLHRPLLDGIYNVARWQITGRARTPGRSPAAFIGPGNLHSRAACGTPCCSRRSASLLRPQGALGSGPTGRGGWRT